MIALAAPTSLPGSLTEIILTGYGLGLAVFVVAWLVRRAVGS